MTSCSAASLAETSRPSAASARPHVRGGPFLGMTTMQTYSFTGSIEDRPEDPPEAWTSTSFIALPVTLGFDLGMQFSSSWALYLRAQGALNLTNAQGSAYLMVERSLARHWSLGTGLGIDGRDEGTGSLWGTSPPNTPERSWTGASIPLLLSYRFRKEPSTGSFRLALEATFGLDPRGWRSGLHQSLTIGYEWM